MTALLRFDDVTLRRGGRLLFEGLNLSLGPGETLQVGGPNGSGKSSLIRLAAGLLHAERGQVQRASAALADDNLALDRELPLKRALSFWGGHAHTAMEAVERALDLGRRPIDGAMEALGIAQLSAVPVRFLSSGQRKRATLARVAASGASLWLLDEPLNTLDADGAARLSKLIAAHLAAGGALITASHQPLPGAWRRLQLGS